MNRAERRERMTRNAKMARRSAGVYLDITPEQLAKALPNSKPGDRITIAGMRRDSKGGIIRIVHDCPPGEETPFILRLTNGNE